MSNIVNKVIEEYIRGLLPQRNELLQNMETFAVEKHVPIIQPEVGKLLEVIIKMSRAKKILEVGTAIGYSTIILASAMKQGKLISIEKRPDMVEIAKKNIESAGLNEQIQILEGSAEKILPTLKEEFDLIFMDAAKGQYLKFFTHSIELLKSEGILISDNVLYKGMIASNQYIVRRKKTIVKRMRTYLEHIMSHPQLTTCILPIGDGVAVSYKK